MTQYKQPPKKSQNSWRPKIIRRAVWALAAIVVIALIVAIAFKVSPWPSALVIRYEFDKGGQKTANQLAKHVPAHITEVKNQQYRTNDKDGYLDVFYPEDTAKPLPTVVWIHGGAWVSGDKNNIDNYLKILAAKGYTAVGVDYSIAPEHRYPLPVHQLNDALGYVQRHANRLHIDPNNIVLAGDSAGSQIAAQVGNIITSPAYAKTVGVQPAISASQLKGMLLNCGAYDLTIADYNGPFGGFLHTVLWAYSGKKNFLDDPALKQASVAQFVTKDFPPTFITAGNADPLLPQSTNFATKLQSLGVPTTTLFYPADHQPELNHEYQFNLDTADGSKAFQRMVDFLQTRVSNT